MPDNHPFKEFQVAYTSLEFGWRYAKEAAENFSMTAWFPPKEKWLWRAFFYIRNNRKDPAIESAKRLWEGCAGPEGGRLRALRCMLESILLSEAAGNGGERQKDWPDQDVKEAYRALFFDVTSRAEDYFWLASVVYPRTRLEEFFPDYFTEETLPDIVKRLAYNKGEEAALYAAGVNTYGRKIAQYDDAAARFERKLLENALVLTELGMLNYPAVHGISVGKQIIAAAKQGGADQTQDPAVTRVAPAIVSIVQKEEKQEIIEIENARNIIPRLQEPTNT